MIDHSVRTVLPRFTRPLITLYKTLKLHPNHLSLFSLVIAGIAAYFLSNHQLTLALLTWWFGRILDGTDGIYAREYNLQSRFGAFLDILCDMASYSLMIVGFALAFPEFAFRWNLVLLLYILCITGALALGSLEDQARLPRKDNRGLRLAVGLAEAGETGIAYSIFLLFPAYISLTLWIWIAVLSWTVLARTFLAKKELA